MFLWGFFGHSLLLSAVGAVETHVVGVSNECEARWITSVHDLLDETQQLVASIEAAAVDGLNGNYVARISTAMNNIQANIDSCPSINMARDKVERIKELEENCPVEHIDEATGKMQKSVFEQQEEVQQLIQRYETAMDQLDEFNRKIWRRIHPAWLTGHQLVDQMRDAVENIAKSNVDSAKSIREEIETKLKESEDDFTRLSNKVDIMIYQVEPVVELISFAGFNQNLCGTDIAVTSCDSECGGVFCNRCGGAGCDGAMEVAHESDDVVHQTRVKFEQAIHKARLFIREVNDKKLTHKSEDTMYNVEQRLVQVETFIQPIIEWLNDILELWSFMRRVVDRDNGPTTHLSVIKETINMEPRQFPDSLKERLQNEGFPENAEDKVIPGDHLSNGYLVARDSRKVLVNSDNAIKRLQQCMEKIDDLRSYLSKSSNGDSDDPQLLQMVNSIRGKLDQLSENTFRLVYELDRIDVEQAETGFRRINTIIEDINNDIDVAEVTLEDALDLAREIYAEYRNIMESEDGEHVHKFIHAVGQIEDIELAIDAVLDGIDGLSQEVSHKRSEILDLKSKLRDGKVKLLAEHDETKGLIDRAVNVRHEIHAHHTRNCH